ncbi:ROK family protein [Cryptosporangium japonicum]|uniref:ROK family transcriptional regulator n=1 Tax=Cryptosporangium japonicum TaxID=80872 RepID=A0ABN0UFA6_9ACTN
MSAPPSARDILVLAQIVDLVRAGTATTRPELETATGLGRTVVNDRVREGLELGVLAEIEAAPSGQRGRPSRAVRFRAEAGVILSAALGAVSLHTAVSDLDGTPLRTAHHDIDIDDGPDRVLAAVHAAFGELLRGEDVWGITLALPGPVDIATGSVVAAPAMPGWEGYDVRLPLRLRYGAPVWVDNEVNLMALGEWERGTPQERRDLLFVKVASGIGSGLVTNGRLHRGDSGAAGDIGHVRVTDDPAALCRCGKTGCLVAVASGWALLRTLEERARTGASPLLARRLAERGRVVPEDIGYATAAGDPVVREAVAASARLVGTTIASVVNFVNPGTLVLGGGVIRYSPLFFDEFRRAVLADTIELAARNLTIRTASLDHSEGAVGGALLAADRLFRPDSLRVWLADGSPVGSALRLQEPA